MTSASSNDRNAPPRSSTSSKVPSTTTTEGGSTAAESSLETTQQKQNVHLLTQALLREFLHRRGFKKTLGVFDVESPRDAMTISSRQRMIDMMWMGPIQERWKRSQQQQQQPPLAEGGKKKGGGGGASATATAAGTFMEMLCAYRIRKWKLRKGTTASGGGQPPSQLQEDAGGHQPASDSSDDERRLEDAVQLKLTNASTASAAASQQAEFEAKKAELETQLATLKAKENKLLQKKNKTTSKESKGGRKGDKKGIDLDNDSEMSNGKSDKKKNKASSNKDPLMAAMSRVSQLPVSSHSTGLGQGVGRNWTPGGSAGGAGGGGDSAPMPIPAIGLNGGSGAVNSATLGRTPSFVAGEGMRLMSDRATIVSKDVPEWEAPTKGVMTQGTKGSTSNLLGNSSPQSYNSHEDDDDSEVPSPYRIGATPYDHTATRPGILRPLNKVASNNPQHQPLHPIGVPASSPGISPSNTPHMQSPYSGSPTSAAPFANTTSGGTQHAAGFGFHGSPTHSGGGGASAAAGAAATTTRTSRRVRILVDGGSE